MFNKVFRYRTLVFIFTLLLPVLAWSGEGMITVKSKHDFAKTVDLFTQTLSEKGFKIFNQVKHSEGAKSVGVDLPDTQLIIFGKPAVGSKLMACQQSVAIDLPMKALVWQQGDSINLSYNDAAYLGKRHDMSACSVLLEKVGGALNSLSQSVQ